MRFSLSVVFLFVTICAWAQNQHPIHPDLTGDELLEALVSDYKTSSTMSYGMARDTLYGIIDVRNDSLECVYSGHQVYLQPGQDPTTFVFNNGDQDGINAEHVYPRSAGADFGNALADMHNIFPCRVEVNTNRGSFPFAEIDDQDTDSWYLNNQELSQIPSSNIDAYSEGIRGIDGRFEPRESKKGDVARAVFYFYTIYNQEAMAANPNFFAPQMSTLCQWHELDPVDQREYDRTFKIAEYQEGKVNPFVLDCSLVERAYCQGASLECPNLPIISSTTAISSRQYNYYPNPVDDLLTVEAEGQARVRIFDLRGYQLLDQNIFKSASIDTQQIPSGIYILQINEQSFKLVK